MIKKISFYFFLPMAVLAMLLSLAGVHYIGFDNTYYNFLQTVNIRLASWSLEIPNIPNIPRISSTNSQKAFELITALIWIGNLLVQFFNGVINLVNILILILNLVIQLVQFIITLVYSIKDFIGSVPTQALMI